MELPQHHNQADQEKGKNKSVSGGSTCRPTSTRWTPTTDQIRILKDIYYNNGVRSPTVDQIQKISSRLRQYGKIEGKNVFYWFQNRKARERQKKRSNSTTTATPTYSSPNSVMMASDDYHHNHHRHGVTIQIPALVKTRDLENINHASPGTEYGDCSMSYNSVGGGWINMDHNPYYPTPFYNFFDRPMPLSGLEGHNQEEGEYGGDAYLEHRRTLPLFPLHDEDHINGGGGSLLKYGHSDGSDCYGRGPCTSLKLCLN